MRWLALRVSGLFLAFDLLIAPVVMSPHRATWCCDDFLSLQTGAPANTPGAQVQLPPSAMNGGQVSPPGSSS